MYFVHASYFSNQFGMLTLLYLNQGLIRAVKELFSDSEHRFCVRHLYQNFQKKFKGETLKNLLWAMARSTNLPKWTQNREKMKEASIEAYN